MFVYLFISFSISIQRLLFVTQQLVYSFFYRKKSLIFIYIYIKMVLIVLFYHRQYFLFIFITLKIKKKQFFDFISYYSNEVHVCYLTPNNSYIDVYEQPSTWKFGTYCISTNASIKLPCWHIQQKKRSKLWSEPSSKVC